MTNRTTFIRHRQNVAKYSSQKHFSGFRKFKTNKKTVYYGSKFRNSLNSSVTQTKRPKKTNEQKNTIFKYFACQVNITLNLITHYYRTQCARTRKNVKNAKNDWYVDEKSIFDGMSARLVYVERFFPITNSFVWTKEKNAKQVDPVFL